MTRPTALNRRDVVARLANAQKSNRGAAAYSRWINRPFGRQIAAVCYLAGLTPDQVSAISAAFTFSAIAGLAIFHPSVIVALCVTVSLVVGYAFDSADGQVARLRGGGSPAGEWLDHVFDAFKTTTLHLAVAIAWFRFYHTNNAVLLIPLGFCVVASVFFFAMILTDLLRRVDRASRGGPTVTTASVNPSEPAPLLRSLIVIPNDYGVLCLVFLLWPSHLIFGWVYAFLFAANAAFLVLGCARWLAEMKHLAPRPGVAVH